MKTLYRVLLSLLFVFSFLVSTLLTAPAANGTDAAPLIAEGRAALFNTGSATYPGRFTYSGISAAKDKFGGALAQDPTNQEAGFFYAFTSILADVNDSGPTSGVISTLRDMVSAFGATGNGNDFLDAGAPFTFNTDPATGDPTLPEDSPTGDQITAFMTTNMIGLINNSLESLDNISDPFDLTLLTTETGDLADTEVDYGDVLALRSMLHFMKFFVLLNSAYDLDDIDIDQLLSDMGNGVFNYSDFLTGHPDLLNLNSNGAATLAQAKTALIDAIDTFLAGADYINNETDDQINDLVTIDPEMAREEQWFRANLNELRHTLTTGNANSGKPFVLDRASEEWRFFNQNGDEIGMWPDMDGNGSLIEASYYNMGNHTFLPGEGSVDSWQINGATVTIQTSCQGQCPCTGTLTGTLSSDGTSITNGTYTADDTCSEPWSGTFTANRLVAEDESVRLNLSAMLDDQNPISLRDMIVNPDPTQPALFVHDPYTDEMMMNGYTSLPDQTFGGILPDGFLEPDINRFAVWGGNNADGKFTRFNIWTYDLPLWEITSATIYGPYPMTAPIDIDLNDPNSYYYNYRSGARLQATGPGILPDGWYSCELVDREGRRYQTEKHFTRNMIDLVDMSTASPTNMTYINTTTPDLSWNTVATPATTTGIFYQVVIEEWSTGRVVYMSDRVSATGLTVPAGYLKTNTPYKWRVQVFDGKGLLAANNFSVPSKHKFHTGSGNTGTDPVSINWAFVRGRVFSEVPDPSDQTQYGINFTGPAPWDITSIDVVNRDEPNANFNMLENATITEDGIFNGSAEITANGTYTFTINDNRTDANPTQATKTTTFTFNRLPVVTRMFSIPWEGEVTTTTPTFAWHPVEDETVSPLYYRVRVIDAAGNTVYKSSLFTNTSHTIPAGYLLPNSGYNWKVEVYDASSADSARNRSDSWPRRFFVAPEATPSSTGSINGAIAAGSSDYTSGGVLYVAAFDRPYTTDLAPLASTTLFDVGAYTLSNLPVNTPLYIYTRWDKNDSHSRTPGDWVGIYTNNPLTLSDTTQISGIDLTLNMEVATQQQIINFDNVDTGWGPIDAATYLANYGINLTNNDPFNTMVQIHRDWGANDGNGLLPSSFPNSLSQDNSNNPVSFTLDFMSPVDNFTFTRPALNVTAPSGITHPPWTARAFNSQGQELGTVGESRKATFTGTIPAATFTLTGPGITTVQFDSDNSSGTAFSSVQLDDFIITRSAAIKGDANSDGTADIGDVIYIFKVLTGRAPGPVDPSADINGDGDIGLAEILYILQGLAK